MGHPTKASWADELVDHVSHSVFQGRSSRGGFPSSPVRGGRRSIVLLGAYHVPYVGAAPGGQESKVESRSQSVVGSLGALGSDTDGEAVPLFLEVTLI